MIDRLQLAVESSLESGLPELVEFSFDTSLGPITCLAELTIAGPCLRFGSVCIYPDHERPIERGAVLKDILAQKAKLLEAVVLLGFSALEVNGTRVQGSSSAKPGREAKIIRSLKPP